MKKVVLDRTGLEVSVLCYGTGEFSKLKKEYGSLVLEKAYKRGINFWDTSDNYGSHQHVKKALKRVGRENIVLMTKITNVFLKEKVERRLKKILRELGTDYIDILILHAVDSEEDLEKYLNIVPWIKESGKVRHIGISSHKTNIFDAVSNNPVIEFILAPYNYRGWKIKGSYNDRQFSIRRRKMKSVLRRCKENNKDIFLIKVFAAGLISNFKKAINYCLEQDFADGIDLGMNSIGEFREDIKLVDEFFEKN